MKKVPDQYAPQQGSRYCAESDAAKLDAGNDVSDTDCEIDPHLGVLLKQFGEPFHSPRSAVLPGTNCCGVVPQCTEVLMRDLCRDVLAQNQQYQISDT